MTEDLKQDAKDREKKAERDGDRLKRGYANVMRTEDGQIVLQDIIFNQCGALYPGQISDHNQVVRNVGLTLLDKLARADATLALQIIDGGHIDGYRRDD
jgi:hypothetical protein